MVQDKNKTAVVLCGHGSRALQYQNSLKNFVKFLKDGLNEKNIFYCFIEINKPLLENCLDSLVDEYSTIYLFPLFIFDGNHYKHDIGQVLLKFEGLNKIKLIDKLSLKKEVMPIISKILNKRLNLNKKNFLLTFCSPSKDPSVMNELKNYTESLSNNLKFSGYSHQFVGKESLVIPQIKKILSSGGKVVLHPIFFFNGFLSKKNILFFKQRLDGNIIYLRPLVYYRGIKEVIVNKLINFS